MIGTRMRLATLMLGLALAFQALAEDSSHKALPSAAALAPAAAMAAGEVRKVDKEAGKITIKHGPLSNLDMPAMTMVFRVKDPAMLDRVKVGDKIHFIAENSGGALTVVQLEIVK